MKENTTVDEEIVNIVELRKNKKNKNALNDDKNEGEQGGIIEL